VGRRVAFPEERSNSHSAPDPNAVAEFDADAVTYDDSVSDDFADSETDLDTGWSDRGADWNALENGDGDAVAYEYYFRGACSASLFVC